jgi:3-phosphoglycerate kinase
LAKKVDLSGKNVLMRVDLNVPLAKVEYTLYLHLNQQ